LRAFQTLLADYKNPENFFVFRFQHTLNTAQNCMVKNIADCGPTPAKSFAWQYRKKSSAAFCSTSIKRATKLPLKNIADCGQISAKKP